MDNLPRCLNEMQDANKAMRCAAFKKMSNWVCATSAEGGELTTLSDDERFRLLRACLKAFEDSSERCREEAVRITSHLLHTSLQDANMLDWVLPAIVTRIGVAPVTETSEEIRLLLLRLASACMTVFPHDIGPRNYIDYLQVLLENCMRDPYPDLKKEACRVTCQLCAIEPRQVRSVSVALAKTLRTSCLLHKHSSVRSEAARTLGVLVQHGAAVILADGDDEPRERGTAAQLFILCNDHSESVRLAVLDVLSSALLDIQERLEQHRKYLPHLLLLSTDAFAGVRSAAMRVLEKLGALYALDNEDNRIDLQKRHVTLKDIAWYADDEYPDMTLTSTDVATRYPILCHRPPLGQRHVVAEAVRTFLPSILSDIMAIDWVIVYSTNNRRVVALRILWNAVFHCEQASVQFTDRILGALYKALRDSDEAVRQEAMLCVEILGKFLTPAQYLPMLVATTPSASVVDTNRGVGDGDTAEDATMTRVTRSQTVVVTNYTDTDDATCASTLATKPPTLFTTAAASTRCGILVALRYFVRGSQDHLIASQAAQVVQALTSPDVIESGNEEVLLCLLDTLRVLFTVLATRGFIATPQHPLPPQVRDDARQRTLDSILFYALLCLGETDFVRVRAQASDCIASLSTIVTGDAEGIYSLHAQRLLMRHGANMPVSAFAKLVAKTPMTTLSGSQLKDIFLHRLVEIDFTIRVTDELQYFAVLERLLWLTATTTEASTDGAKDDVSVFSAAELEELLRLVVMPLASFQPGHAAHLFRKVAVNCLCALCRGRYRCALRACLAANDCALSTRWVSLWCSAADCEDGEVRLACMTALAGLCQLPMLPGAANEVVQSVLLRLDDASDAIRLRTVVGLHAVLLDAALTSCVVMDEVRRQLVPLTRKLLVYLDDEDDTAGTAAVIEACVEQLGIQSPHIVLDLVRAAASKHKDPRPCHRIIRFIEEKM